MTGRSLLELKRPLVLKMGDRWLWACSHGGAVVGDELPPGASRDPWAAMLVLARKHAGIYHNSDEGEEVPWPGSG